MQSSAASQPVGVSAPDGRRQQQLYTARLCAFLARHDPERLPEVDALLDQWSGHEEELFAQLEQRSAA